MRFSVRVDFRYQSSVIMVICRSGLCLDMLLRVGVSLDVKIEKIMRESLARVTVFFSLFIVRLPKPCMQGLGSLTATVEARYNLLFIS